VGWLETVSASAHLYFRRDAPELAAFRSALGV